MLFRQIHVAVDAYEGQIDSLSFWNYLNYQLNVFGFVAGPIQRYQDFCRCWTDLAPILSDAESILRAYLRIFIGVVKIALVGQLCLDLFNSCSNLLSDAVQAGHETQGMRILQFLAVFYCYPLYIYFNFSGYCDMVIAGASLFGLKMPENFDRPYLSRNMIDYWTRFHRTLGFWIRDYIFTPMYKGVAARWPARAASLAFLCYLVAFTLAGIWHGHGWNFVIFGLLNGLGAAAAKLWETGSSNDSAGKGCAPTCKTPAFGLPRSLSLSISPALPFSSFPPISKGRFILFEMFLRPASRY